MNIANHIIGLAAAAMLSASAGAAGAGPVPATPVKPPETVVNVQADCNALARQMAQQYGGRARASVQNRGGGQRVCVVVVVVEGKGGERGQRIKREFPLN